MLHRPVEQQPCHPVLDVPAACFSQQRQKGDNGKVACRLTMNRWLVGPIGVNGLQLRCLSVDGVAEALDRCTGLVNAVAGVAHIRFRA